MNLKKQIEALRAEGQIITQTPEEALQASILDPEAKADCLEAALRRTIERNKNALEKAETWRPYPKQTRPTHKTQTKRTK